MHENKKNCKEFLDFGHLHYTIEHKISTSQHNILCVFSQIDLEKYTTVNAAVTGGDII